MGNTADLDQYSFIDAEGKIYLVRCPKCNKENYSMSVAVGCCGWCGLDASKYYSTKHKEIKILARKLKAELVIEEM